jgi:hypothetical protein
MVVAQPPMGMDGLPPLFLEMSARQTMTSHDSFFFQAPVPAGVLANTNHKQNMWSGESRVIWCV